MNPRAGEEEGVSVPLSTSIYSFYESSKNNLCKLVLMRKKHEFITQIYE
jgi:hypothetical protein